jgi:hypothetical protein
MSKFPNLGYLLSHHGRKTAAYSHAAACVGAATSGIRGNEESDSKPVIQDILAQRFEATY